MWETHLPVKSLCN